MPQKRQVVRGNSITSGSYALKVVKLLEEIEKHIEVEKTICSPKQSIIGPVFKEKSKAITEYLENLKDLPEKFPLKFIINGEEIIIEEQMIEIKNIKFTERGEWFTPHVIEPAFGIDRIIWHILEHSHKEILKEGDETYTILSLNDKIAPLDFSVYPLYEKDGMKESAQNLIKKIREINGINVNYDGSKSIGRRYARGDEVGVPFAITVDHQTIDDDTITLRERDSQKQRRMSISELLEFISNY